MNFDNHDQEVEYERLREALTGDGADELVHSIHGEDRAPQASVAGTSKLVHLYAVSDLAANHADIFYTDHDFNTQQYGRTVCRLAGLLHEAVEWGATFEDLVDVSDQVVAQTVAALTPDRRLPQPKRQRLLTNQVGLAEADTQIVKLADMQVDCVTMLAAVSGKCDEDKVSAIRSWVDDARELIPVLNKIAESPYLANQLEDLKEKVTQLRYRCEELCRRKRRKR